MDTKKKQLTTYQQREADIRLLQRKYGVLAAGIEFSRSGANFDVAPGIKWTNPAVKSAEKMMLEYFELVKDRYPYVVLIKSTNKHCRGYWLEFGKFEVDKEDKILCANAGAEKQLFINA